MKVYCPAAAGRQAKKQGVKSAMLKYAAKRIVLGIVTLFVVSALTFFLMNMVPGGPFMAEKAISQQAMDALNEKYGLDKPLTEQFANYMKAALHGDFGPSLRQRGRNVTDIILDRFPVSARLGGCAVLLALCVGIPL